MTSNLHIKDVEIVSVFTLVLWVCCLTAGVVGMLVPYPHPLPARELPPVEAQIMNVRIAPQAMPMPRTGAPDSAPPAPDVPLPAQPPPPPTMDAAPAPPALAVALPSPTIAFAQPVAAAPVRIVPARQAVPSTAPPKAANPAPPAPPAVRQITFGQGEGQQPAPDYPREAVEADQQGTVVVRFTVAADGSVVSAAAKVPCPFPLLNQAAVRAVRETWRFQPGPARIYEVSIHFELTDD